MQLPGLWAGMTCSWLCAGMAYGYVLYFTDWQEEVAKAELRNQRALGTVSHPPCAPASLCDGWVWVRCRCGCSCACVRVRVRMYAWRGFRSRFLTHLAARSRSTLCSCFLRLCVNKIYPYPDMPLRRDREFPLRRSAPRMVKSRPIRQLLLRPPAPRSKRDRCS